MPNATQPAPLATQARRQAALVANADRLADDQKFVEAVSASWDEE